jgi:two-component sensor histidine kinase
MWSSLRATPLNAASAQLATLALVAIATAARIWLGHHFTGLVPFSLYFPVILAAAMLGGWPAAATALVASLLLGWYLFLGPAGWAIPDASALVNLLLYVFAGGWMAFAGIHVRHLIGRLRAGNARLAERELRYRTLFEATSEGFALVQAIRGADGALVDYRILEANPAILRMLGAPPSIVGKTGREVFPQVSEAYLDACDRALKGEPITFEFQGRASGAWYEIHLAQVTDDQLAQVVIDVSDRKKADARQAELFDELNHRVKNNLAMVSSMLALQARMGDGVRVREHLHKAVDRIHAIAEVHGSLYRSSRKDDVDFAAYLQDLCRRLSSSLLEGDRVRLHCHVDPAVMPLDKAVALGVVVNELVTNAAKHAYPEPAGGPIEVKLVHAAPGLLLSVGDVGCGLPPETPSTGLGMRLVRSLVQQIGATLEIERGPGAVFRVRLPEAAQPQQPAGQARLF